MEDWRRSILKTVTYRVAGLFVTFGVAWLLTGRADLATYIGMGDFAVKVGVYYVHERLWTRVRFGRMGAGDYEI